MQAGGTHRIERCETSTDAPGCLVLTLEDGARCAVDIALALDLGLAAGGEIADALIAALQDPEAFRRAMAVCNRLIAGRLRSEKEIADALRRRKYDDTIVEALVDRLRRAGALDDERFAGAYIRDAARFRPRSKAALRAELRRKGIAADVIVRALEADYPDENEHATALEAGRAYLRRRPAADTAVLARRLAAFLARRGYAHEVIRTVCRALLADADAGAYDQEDWD